MILTILVDNAGWDSSELVAKLRKRHFAALEVDGDAEGMRMGLDMERDDVGDMKTLGITESYKLKRQVVVSASEAAEMILRYVFILSPFLSLGDISTHFWNRVDTILRAAPRKREGM